MKTLSAIVVTGLVAGSAAAQDRVAIEYTDIATASDADALYHRIRNAAGAVCPRIRCWVCMAIPCLASASGMPSPRQWKTVDSPLLTARHHGETGNKLYSSRAARK